MILKASLPLAATLALLFTVSASPQTSTDKYKPKPAAPAPRVESRPAPRPEPRQEPRQEPREEARPAQRPYQAPRQQEQADEQPRRNNAPASSDREYRPSGEQHRPSGVEYHPAAPATTYRQTAPLHEHEYRYNVGANHPGTRIITPPESAAFRRARIYNTRANGMHITPEYFSANFGLSHQFHFLGVGPPYFELYQNEWYFQSNGLTFGVMGMLPSEWHFATDNLYIDIGDDGNYYLYDNNQADFAIQLTFVQAKGDDQADYPDSDNTNQ